MHNAASLLDAVTTLKADDEDRCVPSKHKVCLKWLHGLQYPQDFLRSASLR